MKEDINKAVEVLKKGGIILYPTDTIWGIGCDATNASAVEKIYKIKQRSDAKAMLVLVGNPMDLEYYVEDVPEIAYDLIETSDRPMTIIYDKSRGLASNLCGEDGSIGIRVASDEFVRELCRRLRKPIVSTSANISGENTPTVFQEIDDCIKQQMDYVVEYRQNDMTKSQPSSIIKLSKNGVIKIIRP